MLITGKWHDYYDCVLGTTGVDKAIVYPREAVVYERVTNSHLGQAVGHQVDRVEPWKDAPAGLRALHDDLTRGRYAFSGPLTHGESQRRHKAGMRHLEIETMVVGFCGRLYPRFGYREYAWPPRGTLRTRYSGRVDLYRSLQEPYQSRHARSRRQTKFERLIENIPDGDCTDLFVDAGVPVFCVSRDTILLNFPLREVEFQSVVDPWTTFQEIMQFVSGVLGQPARETVDISDEKLARAKGFDEWSFRRLPSKGKKRCLPSKGKKR